MNFHRQGKLRDAITIYRQFIKDDPQHPVANHFLGLALIGTGDVSEGVKLVERSISIDPKVDFYLNYGLALLQLEKPHDAVHWLAYARQLNPALEGVHLAIGQAELRCKNFRRSLESFERALQINPASAPGFYGQVSTLRLMGDPDSALRAIENRPSSISMDKSLMIVHLELLQEKGRFADSIGPADHWLSQHPIDDDVLFLKAVGLQNTTQLSAAVAAYDEILSRDSRNAMLLVNKASALRGLGRMMEATEAARAATVVSPDAPETHFALGQCLQAVRRFEDAAHSFERALELRPDFYVAEKEAAFAWLLAARFDKGWPLFERRDRWFDALPPEFRGAHRDVEMLTAINEVDADRPIFLLGEQGIGDEIMFTSLLGDFSKRYKSLSVVVDPRLLSLFSRSFPDVRFVDHSIALQPNGQYVRLGSIGPIVRPSKKDFDEKPKFFLVADSDRVEKLSKLVNPKNDILVGLSWKTINPLEQGHRSISPNLLAGAVRLPGIRYVSLQYDSNEIEVGELQSVLGDALSPTPNVDLQNDLESVAALIKCCDIVVTIGNSITHLAGAIGTPTIALISYAPSWRWMGDDENCVWYQSVCLIRQESANRWHGALTSLRKKLASLTNSEIVETEQQSRFHSDPILDRALQEVDRLTETGDYGAADSALERILAKHPDEPLVVRARAGQEFSAGNYQRAISLLRTVDPRLTGPFRDRIWDGRYVDGTLLVSLEPNLGEEVLLSSLLTELHLKAKTIIVEIDGRLLRLFRRSFPRITFYARGSDSFNRTIKNAGVFKVASSTELLENFMASPNLPGKPAWLIPESNRVLELRRKYRGMFPNKMIVAISWRSSRLVNGLDLKSAPLNQLQMTMKNSKCAFIDVQYGQYDSDRHSLKRQGHDLPWRDPEINPTVDIDDLAAQLKSADCIVTVSNSTAHLSGAVGANTIVLLPKFYPQMWHWGNYGSRSYWYESVEIIRNPVIEGWRQVDSLLAARLDQYADLGTSKSGETTQSPQTI